MRTFLHENRTPNGNPFKLWCRTGTNDQNTAHSVSKLDEYGLRGLKLEGWALDIGAYIGAVAIPLAIDNPGLTVVAVEPVPENIRLLYRNVSLNGVEDRVHVSPHAATGPGDALVEIRYGGTGQHRYVGNAGETGDNETILATTVTLLDLLEACEISEVALLKIDCEGCEWGFLNTEATMFVHKITGEYHGQFPTDFLPLHEVRIDDNWHFWAERL